MTVLTLTAGVTGRAAASATLASPPASAARWYDPVLSFALAGFIFLAGRRLGLADSSLALAMTLSVTLLFCAVDIARAPWRRGARAPQDNRLVARRAGIKWLGLMACLGLMLCAWAPLRDYADGPFQPLFEAQRLLLPFVPALMGAVVVFTEWRLGPAEDAAWHLGLLVLGQRKKTDEKLLLDGILGWLVRGFFLPMNFCALSHLVHALRDASFYGSWQHVIDVCTAAISLLLVTAILPGYLMNARLTGAGTRKMDQSWLGWGVTLVCYKPFMSVVFGQLLNFYTLNPAAPGEKPWFEALQGAPALLAGAGGAIILLELVHYWGEAIFGLRSSILANRGIITNGPFRFCKHPVYLVKCLSWLIVWMPFYAGGSLREDCRLTFFWACVCAIYAGRAYAEERLLSDDPVYVAYALWIDQHGIFSKVGRRLPVLSFGWRLRRWQPKTANM